MEASNSMNRDQVMTMMYTSSDEQVVVDQVAAADEEEEEERQLSSGVGRSYECVFCRRGFNTAQALGGHMNIHRKDRARNNFHNKPTVINTGAEDDYKKKQEENYYYYYYNYYYLCQQQQQIPRCSVHLPAPDRDHRDEEAVQLRHRNYNNSNNNSCQEISSVSSSSSGGGAGFFCGNHHRELYVEEDIGGRRGGERITNMSLRPPFGSSTRFAGEIRQEELDLELRL